MNDSLRKNNWNNIVNTQKLKKSKDETNLNKIESYYFIYNCFDNKIEYVNNTFEILTGFNINCFTIDHLIEMIHPDDLEHFLNCEKKGLEFTNMLSFNENFRYLLSHSYRIKTAHNDYITIRQHCQAIEVNTDGHLTKTFVTHQKVEDSSDRLENDYYIFDKDKNQKLEPNNFYNLTKREREILDLVQDGLTTKQIAEKLYSSKNTIDTHRKNILKKTNAKNFFELVTKLNGIK